MVGAHFAVQRRIDFGSRFHRLDDADLAAFFELFTGFALLDKDNFAQLVGGDTRFVLAGSGHLAGVINPPDKGKYPHWVNTELPDTAASWFDGAEQVEGSWWPDWHQWLATHDSTKVTAPKPGKHKAYPAVEAAPGSYVKKRLD